MERSIIPSPNCARTFPRPKRSRRKPSPPPGTAAAPVREEFGVEDITVPGVGLIHARFTKEIRIGEGGAETEWTKSYQDMAGRTFRAVTSANAIATFAYNSVGQLAKSVDPDGVVMLYAYNAKGERIRDVVDVNRNGVIDLGGTDRIVQTLPSVTERGAGGPVVSRVEVSQWQQDDNGSATVVSIAESTANGSFFRH